MLTLCLIDKPSTALDNENEKNTLLIQGNAKITACINRPAYCIPTKKQKIDDCKTVKTQLK